MADNPTKIIYANHDPSTAEYRPWMKGKRFKRHNVEYSIVGSIDTFDSHGNFVTAIRFTDPNKKNFALPERDFFAKVAPADFY